MRQVPYETINDLPKAVRTDLPENAQRLFLKTYNDAHRDSGDDDFSRQAAWDAVTQLYEQDEAGDWHAREAQHAEEIVQPEDE